MLAPYTRLQSLFSDLARCIKHGDLAGFDAALSAGEDEFVKRRIYLTLERGRDIALRNLLRKVYLAGGFEEAKDGGPSIRRTRIPVIEFAAAVRLGSKTQGDRLDVDEVECLLANMIYKVSTHTLPLPLPLKQELSNVVRCSWCSFLEDQADLYTFWNQSLIKGYIARDRGIVVLSKGSAFPGTGV